MAKYTPRLTAPSTTDKNWLHYSNGGYNYCIEIKNGSCLPNCVGYAWGRWREILGKKHKLSLNNAENWWANTADGYKRGQTPKVGAVMCWRKGKAGVSSDGAGHVAVVEKINSDGSVTYSNSNYSGTRFYTKTLKAPYKLGSAYTFQGFIYLPIEFDEDKPVANTTTTKPTTTTATIAAGTKLTLKNVILYASSSAATKAGTRTGDFYVWSKDVVNNRIRITNSKSNVGKSNQVTGWISYADAKKSVSTTTTTSTAKTKTLEDWAREVIAGKHGNGMIRRVTSLKKAGCPYSYAQVQAKVNTLL